MNFWKCSAQIAAGSLALFSVGSALPAQSPSPRTIVAVFSQEDPDFSETVTLYSDGKYMQSETEKKEAVKRGRYLHGLPSSGPVFQTSGPVFQIGLFTPNREGIWHVLDRDSKQPIAFKTLSALPAKAVIDLERAMPFGMIWDDQLPYQFSATRLLPAASFQATPAAVPPVAIPPSLHPKIVIGSIKAASA